MDGTRKTIFILYAAALAAMTVFAPANALAEEKFFDRTPQPASYSALCQYYRQEDLPTAADGIKPGFTDFRACDLSAFDLSHYTLEEALNFSFDSLTKWPDKSKMPKGFKPEKLLQKKQKTMEQAKKYVHRPMQEKPLP